MTRLFLSSFRNTLFRPQRPLRTALNNSGRYLSEASSLLSRGAHEGEVVSNNVVENPIPTLPQSSKLEGEAESGASGPTTLTEEQPEKKRRRTNKIVDADASEEQKPKKRGKKNTDKPVEAPAKARRKGTLRNGEVLPKVPPGDLPPLDMWRKYFPMEKAAAHRCVVRKPETAAMLADIFVPEGSKDKIIIEASPGPGQLTRALLRLPKERVKKIFVLEVAKSYLEYLEPLEKLDSRVKIYRQHGRDWEAYSKLRNDGAFEGVAQADWDEVHPQLQFIMHMDSWVDGEQLLSQFFRCIPDRQWLFHYGRVPMNLILPTRMWERVNAVEGTTARCKLSVIAQATADLKECVHPEVLKPYTEHFHPDVVHVSASSTNPRGSYLEPRRLGTPHMAINALPLQHQCIARGDLDIWDYVLRKLFVLKATSVERCLNSNVLGPGSNNLIPKLTDRSQDPEKIFDLTTKGPRDLSIHEWGIMFEAFKQWPFRPEDIGIEAFFETKWHNR